MIPEATKERIRESLTLSDVVGQYVELKRQGQDVVGKCPFCGGGDKTPPFSVSDSKAIYKCFSCGESGDAFTFVQKMDRVEFPDAIRKLGALAGVTIEEKPQTPEQRQERDQTKNRAQAAEWANRQAADLWAAQLWADSAALEYVRGRGFSDDTIKAWQIGLATSESNQVRKHLVAKAGQQKAAKATQAAIDAGLAKYNDKEFLYEVFRNRIIFPTIDHRGRYVGFGGRAMDPDAKAKYLNTGETDLFKKGRILYGLHQAEKATRADRVLILVEGYTDVIAAHQAGFENVVATNGTSLTPDHVALLKRYADTVVACFDTDTAGQKAARRATELAIAGNLRFTIAANPAASEWQKNTTYKKDAIVYLSKDDYWLKCTSPGNSADAKPEAPKLTGEKIADGDIEWLSIEPEKDPADVLQRPGGDKIFSSWIDHAFDSWGYLLSQNTKDAQTPTEKAKAAEDMARIITTTPSPVAQEAMVKELATATGSGVKTIRDMITDKNKNRKKSSNSGSEETTASPVLTNYNDDEFALRIQAITRKILTDHKQTIGAIGQNLFSARPQKNNLDMVVSFINNTDKLFAWLHNQYMIRWIDRGQDPAGANYLTRAIMYQEIVDKATAYRGISAHPFAPEPKDMFIRWTAPDYKPTGEYFGRFLDFFNPASDTDAALIRCLILTMVWGGAPGQRPLFIVCPEGTGSQQAIGKSALVQKCAKLVGGHMALSIPKRGSYSDALAKQALEEINLPFRVAIIDNVTGTIRDDSLTELITSPKIAGRASYAKQAERSNRITWVITTNEPNLSTDIATRSVLIRLAPADRTKYPNWDAEIDAFLDAHQDQILADIIGEITEPATRTTLSKHTRFPAWDNATVGTQDNADQIIAAVIKEQEEADCDGDEMIDFLAELAEKFPAPRPQTRNLKLSEIAEAWGSIHPGSKLSSQQIAQILKNAASRGTLTGESGEPILEHKRTNKGRIWPFRPWDMAPIGDATDDTVTAQTGGDEWEVK